MVFRLRKWVVLLVLVLFGINAFAVFPDGWGRKCSLEIPAAWVSSGTLDDFPVLFTQDNLPSEMLDADAGVNDANSDGSDIRFSSDAAGASPLNVEVVEFTQANDPTSGTAEIWVRVDSLSSSVATTIYVWYDNDSATLPAADDATYGSQGVWDASSQATLHLEETVNNDADGYADSTANAAHFTGNSMSISAPAGQIGTGQQTDGSADYLYNNSEIPTAFDSAANATFSFWGYRSSTAYYVIGGFYVAPYRLNFIWYSDGNIYPAATGAYESAALTGTGWHHFAIRYDGAETGWNRAKLYVDGAQATYLGGSGAPDATLSTAANLDAFLLGAEIYTGTSWRYATAIFDELRISSITRTEPWIAAEYNTGASPGDVTVGTPASTGSYISDATEDSGFHLGENLSTVDTAAGDGDDAMESMYMLFKNWPDLTGKTIISCTLYMYASTVANLDSRDISGQIYVAVAGAWSDDTATYLTVDALSMGADIGEDLDPIQAAWGEVDLTTAIQAIYTADSTPADITIKLTNAYWQSTLTPDDELASLEQGDRGGATGYAKYDTRGDTYYPYIVIVAEDAAAPAATPAQSPSVGMILGRNYNAEGNKGSQDVRGPASIWEVKGIRRSNSPIEDWESAKNG